MYGLMKVTRMPMAKPLKIAMVMVFSRSWSVGVSAVTIQAHDDHPNARAIARRKGKRGRS